jgi:hypothetical protein
LTSLQSVGNFGNKLAGRNLAQDLFTSLQSLIGFDKVTKSQLFFVESANCVVFDVVKIAGSKVFGTFEVAQAEFFEVLVATGGEFLSVVISTEGKFVHVTLLSAHPSELDN